MKRLERNTEMIVAVMIWQNYSDLFLYFFIMLYCFGKKMIKYPEKERYKFIDTLL